MVTASSPCLCSGTFSLRRRWGADRILGTVASGDAWAEAAEPGCDDGSDPGTTRDRRTFSDRASDLEHLAIASLTLTSEDAMVLVSILSALGGVPAFYSCF